MQISKSLLVLVLTSFMATACMLPEEAEAPNTGSQLSQGLSTNSTPTSPSFRNLPSMPSAISCSGGGVIGTKLYVAGGCDSPNESSKVLAYDFISEVWSNVANMKTASAFPASAVVNGSLYIIGGLTNGFATAAVQQYNPILDTWTNKTAGTFRGLMAPTAVSIEDDIYVVGGCNQGNTIFMYRYNTVNDTWTTLSGFRGTFVCNASAVAYEGSVYLVGGYSGVIGEVESFYVYHPSSDTWETLTPMSIPREGAVAKVIGTKMYVLGGGYQNSNEYEYFDFSTGTWTSHLPAPRFFRYSVGGVYNSKIYLAGGIYGADSAILDMLLGFSP